MYNKKWKLKNPILTKNKNRKNNQFDDNNKNKFEICGKTSNR